MSTSATKARSTVALTRYVRRVQGLMDLGEWTIDVDWNCKTGEAGAIDFGLGWWDGTARMSIDPVNWKHSDLEDRRRTVVHELLHLHLMPMRYLNVRRDTEEYAAEEMIVERLCNVVCPHMPLPVRV